MTQGKIERCHRSLKNGVKLAHAYSPWELQTGARALRGGRPSPARSRGLPQLVRPMRRMLIPFNDLTPGLARSFAVPPHEQMPRHGEIRPEGRIAERRVMVEL